MDCFQYRRPNSSKPTASHENSGRHELAYLLRLGTITICYNFDDGSFFLVAAITAVNFIARLIFPFIFSIPFMNAFVYHVPILRDGNRNRQKHIRRSLLRSIKNCRCSLTLLRLHLLAYHLPHHLLRAGHLQIRLPVEGVALGDVASCRGGEIKAVYLVRDRE